MLSYASKGSQSAACSIRPQPLLMFLSFSAAVRFSENSGQNAPLECIAAWRLCHSTEVGSTHTHTHTHTQNSPSCDSAGHTMPELLQNARCCTCLLLALTLLAPYKYECEHSVYYVSGMFCRCLRGCGHADGRRCQGIRFVQWACSGHQATKCAEMGMA